MQVSQQLWDGQLPTFILLDGGKEVARLPHKKSTAWKRPKFTYVRAQLRHVHMHAISHRV